MLSVDAIHTRYGDTPVLHGVSLEAAAGEGLCVLGRNGAGKTTTLRSIAGLTPPVRGRVRLRAGDQRAESGRRARRPGMSMHRKIRVIAGTLILISLALAHWVSPWWLLFTAFVGANLLQSGLTRWCLMEDILRTTGLHAEWDESGGV